MNIKKIAWITAVLVFSAIATSAYAGGSYKGKADELYAIARSTPEAFQQRPGASVDQLSGGFIGRFTREHFLYVLFWDTPSASIAQELREYVLPLDGNAARNLIADCRSELGSPDQVFELKRGETVNTHVWKIDNRYFAIGAYQDVLFFASFDMLGLSIYSKLK